MAYCRYSSDDWRSDLYCYESQTDFVVAVAETKFKNPPPRITVTFDDDRYFIQYRRQQEGLEELETVEIGLEHDGETFRLATEKEMFETVVMLSEMGYNVPEEFLKLCKESI